MIDKGRKFVAVYGTLMTGERNERWRSGVPTVATGTMKGVLYDTGWGFPTFVPGEGADVRCEVLETDDAGIARMDILEGYPRMYGRRKVKVSTDDGRVMEALVYVMNDVPDRATVIDCGDWCAYRTDMDRLADRMAGRVAR